MMKSDARARALLQQACGILDETHAEFRKLDEVTTNYNFEFASLKRMWREWRRRRTGEFDIVEIVNLGCTNDSTIESDDPSFCSIELYDPNDEE